MNNLHSHTQTVRLQFKPPDQPRKISKLHYASPYIDFIILPLRDKSHKLQIK